MEPLGYLFVFVIGTFGLLLMLAGGSFGRPRYFWQVSVVLGSLYIIPFFGLIPGLYDFVHAGRMNVVVRQGVVITLLTLPGPACFLFGLLPRRNRTGARFRCLDIGACGRVWKWCSVMPRMSRRSRPGGQAQS